MRENITSSIVFNQVMMIEAVSPRLVIVLVEDSASGYVAKHAMLNPYLTRVVVAHRKEWLYQTLARREVSRLVIGIADADHERLIGSRPPAQCFWFDRRDLEIFLLFTDAFTRVMDALAPGLDSVAVRDEILAQCALVGAARYTAIVQGVGVSFAGLSLDSMYDPQTRRLVVAAFEDWMDAQGRAGLVHESVLTTTSASEYVRGHDVTNLISAQIRYHGHRQISTAAFEQDLQIAVRPQDLEGSDLLRNLREWEDTNQVVLLLE